jgi:sulfotransferase
MDKIFFNASMPQSGSELIQVLLHQNPTIYASPTSPLLEFVYGARSNTGVECYKAQPRDIMDKAFLEFCKAGMKGYYESITDRPYVIDKSRGWSHYKEWVDLIVGGKSKIICMVRDIRSIISHMEKVYRDSRHLTGGPDDPINMRNLTVEQRAMYWLGTQPIGLALDRTRDLLQRGVAADILFIRYEDLTQDPDEQMKRIYEYLELPYFQHDYKNIVKEVPEDDAWFGPYGSHKVGRELRLARNNYEQILGKRVSDMVYERTRWYQDAFYLR